MTKNDFLTPKAIANRIKAKGLQKLRWYCQMCQKQCRDENGFKCHCMSESHQRQMQVFGQNPNRIVDGYSEEFESAFMEHVRRSHRFSRVAATVLYNEYISDRHHIHMNSTKWATLTEFVKHLGRTGQCKVDETEKGWFVTYIDRGSEAMLRESLKNKRQKADLADEERHELMIESQIKRARAGETSSKTDDTDILEKSVFQRDNISQDAKITFALKSGVTHSQKGVGSTSVAANSGAVLLDHPAGGGSESQQQLVQHRSKQEAESMKAAALAELMEEEEKAKERVNRKDYWLVEGLVVKVMSKSLADQGFYKQKGVVRKVIGKYVGEIKMLDKAVVLKVDQEELETVIPQIGGLVKIVNGAYRGATARLLSIDTANFTAKVQIEKGMYDGRILKAIEYEDICKFLPSS